MNLIAVSYSGGRNGRQGVSQPISFLLNAIKAKPWNT